MHRFLIIFVLAVGGLSGYWLWNHNHQVRQSFENYIENKELLTFESRYSSDQILEEQILASREHIGSRLQVPPALSYYPYLLLDVYYVTGDHRLHEGLILWSMTEGEMVLDSSTWELSNGFETCLITNATRADFKVMNSIARHGGNATRNHLSQEMRIDLATIEPWIQGAFQKNLISQKDSILSLQFHHPNFYVTPQTRINQWLVTKQYQYAHRLPENYSKVQIERIANAAFGQDFTIRESKIVYLPVYSIVEEKANGTTATNHWNGLTGKRIHPKLLAHVL